MKKALELGVVMIGILLLMSCGKNSILDSENPVTLNMWHVYGSQSESPMNDRIETFNQTVGKKEGIRINVTSVSNSSSIHDALVKSAHHEPGAGELPDLFVCYPKTAVEMGTELLLDWKQQFSEEELGTYVESFMQEGLIDGEQIVFPIAKSSEAIFVNETTFNRFSEDTGINYESLSTWEGFFEAAEAYYKWSDGKAFFMHDSPTNYSMVNTVSFGDSFFTDERKVDFSKQSVSRVLEAFAKAAVKGNLCLMDDYATTAIMTGQAVCGIESTASILYFQDTVTYPDNQTEPLKLKTLPVPVFKDAKKTVIQRGVGLCALKSDEKKEYAASLFCKWISEKENNLSFVTSAGYMPVKEDAFEELLAGKYEDFQNEQYRDLYDTIAVLYRDYEFYTPPNLENYGKLEKKYDQAFKEVFRNGSESYKRGGDLKTSWEQAIQDLVTRVEER